MGKFSRQVINDTSKPRPQSHYSYKDEPRIDRRPTGKVERFVDPQGNVVNLQLASAGDPAAQATADRKRAEFRRDGFVEHAKCPHRTGAWHSPRLKVEILDAHPKLHTACSDDPKVMSRDARGLIAGHGCHHIEWLIQHRRDTEAKQMEKRNALRAADEKRATQAEELRSVQLEIAKEELEARKAKRKGPRSEQ